MGVLRSPLVLVSGNASQLPPGDFVNGVNVTAIAGSGLVGGGTDVNQFRYDVGLAAAPSGLIFVGTKLALDGVAQRTAEQALASGNLAIASGNAAQFTANQALASGNAALANPGNFTGGTLTSNLTLASGTTSAAPLTFKPGTNLTTATAGSFEYDGTVIYSTPNASSGRGFSPSVMVYRLDSALVGGTGTSAQNIFGVGLTVQGSTVYLFEALYRFQKSAGSTSHNFGISLGGTATLNNIAYQYLSVGLNTSTATAGTSTLGFRTTASNINLLTSITTVNEGILVQLRGSLSVNASGTIIPQYTLSANPGGAYSTEVGSYFKMYPVGIAGANTSIGAWA